MNKKKKIILSIAAAIIAVLCLRSFINNVRYNKACDAYDKALEVYLEKIKSMDYSCDEDGYISAVKVDTKVSQKSEGKKSENIMYYHTMNINLKDEFADLSDEEKCSLLCKYKGAAYEELERVGKECGYEDCKKAILGRACYEIKYRGRTIDIDRYIKVNFWNDRECYDLDTSTWFKITSPSGDDSATRLYRYDTIFDRLTSFRLVYPIFSADIYKAKNSSTTSNSTTTKKVTDNSSFYENSSSPKSKKKVYNVEPRDIDDVDIDSFYEDNMDEFEDYDDAWDYMEDNPEEWDDY